MIWELQQTMTIVTSLDIYKDVAIKEFSTTRDTSSGDALEITVTFQQIRKVKLKTLKASAVVGPKDMKTQINRQTAVTTDQGKAVGETVTMDLGEGHISGVVK